MSIKTLHILLCMLIVIDPVRGYPNSDNSSSLFNSPGLYNSSSPDVPIMNNTYEVFRAQPVIKIRPLNDVIDISTDGLIELYMDNPSVNDVTLNVDIRMNVPSGIHILGEGFGEFSGAGTVYGKFNISPGSAKTIYINIRPEKAGKFFVQLDAIYWPGDDKESYQQIILTHDFRSIEITPSPTPTPLPTPTPVTIKEFLQILDQIIDSFERIIRIFEDVRRSTDDR